MKYFTSEQVFDALVSGEAKRHVIYASMAAAKSRGYTDRMNLFSEALSRFDEHRKAKKDNK